MSRTSSSCGAADAGEAARSPIAHSGARPLTPAGHELELERKFGEFSTFADVTPTATGLAENHPFVLNLQTQMWAYCNENGEPHENPAAEKLMKEWGMADAQFKWETLDNYSDRV